MANFTVFVVQGDVEDELFGSKVRKGTILSDDPKQPLKFNSNSDRIYAYNRSDFSIWRARPNPPSLTDYTLTPLPVRRGTQSGKAELEERLKDKKIVVLGGTLELDIPNDLPAPVQQVNLVTKDPNNAAVVATRKLVITGNKFLIEKITFPSQDNVQIELVFFGDPVNAAPPATTPLATISLGSATFSFLEESEPETKAAMEGLQDLITEYKKNMEDMLEAYLLDWQGLETDAEKEMAAAGPDGIKPWLKSRLGW